MSELSFSTDSIPEQVFTKQSEPNPFEDQVKALAENRSVASTVVVPTDEVTKRVRQAQAMGEPLGVTVRKKITDNGDGTSALTIWVTDRITRPRKEDKTDSGK